MRSRIDLVMILIASWSTPLAFGAEQTFGGDFGAVRSDIFIPDVKIVRGLIVHVMNAQFKTDDRWADLCRELNFAHVVMSIDRKANNRPNQLAKALEESLKDFAEKSRHPELIHAPRVGTGHSAGGMVTEVLIRDPAKTLTICVDCSWFYDPAKLTDEGKKVPLLFTMGAIPDAFKMLPAIEQFYEPARKANLPWGLGLQQGCAHDWGNAGTLQVAWIKSAVQLRLPPDADPLKGPVPLKPIRLEKGWLGDRSTIEGTFATIASYDDYKGDKEKATWFPDRASAEVWRAWSVKNSPVQLEATLADESAKLPRFDPKKSRDFRIPAGMGVKLSCSVKPDLQLKKVTYYAGDSIIAETNLAPWNFDWKKPTVGSHAVYARWLTTDGKEGVSNPALFRVLSK